MCDSVCVCVYHEGLCSLVCEEGECCRACSVAECLVAPPCECAEQRPAARGRPVEVRRDELGDALQRPQVLARVEAELVQRQQTTGELALELRELGIVLVGETRWK